MYGSSPAPRDVFGRSGRAVRNSAVQADAGAGMLDDDGSGSEVVMDDVNLPPGCKRVLRDGAHLARSYYVYESDLGTFQTRLAAWEAYGKAGDSPSGSSLSSPEASGGKSLRAAKTFARAPAVAYVPPSSKSREVQNLVAAQGELFGRASQDS